MKKFKAKRHGLALEAKTFTGKSGHTYLAFKTPKGSFHVFVETEAKAAAKDCGGKGRQTHEYWKSIWD